MSGKLYEGETPDGRPVVMTARDLDCPPGSRGKPTFCEWTVGGKPYRTEGNVGSLDVRVLSEKKVVHETTGMSHLNALLQHVESRPPSTTPTEPSIPRRPSGAEA